MRVYFVRHGESAENAIQKSTNPQAPGLDLLGGAGDRLTDTGWKQARALGVKLANKDITHIFQSTLQRARETATGINETLDLPVETLKFIDETTQSKQFYDSDGKKEYNWSIWMPKSPADQAPEGAESFGQIMERTQKLDAYLQKHAADKNILVVTHGTFLRFFLGHVLLGGDFTPHLVSLVWKIYTTNTGISMLEYREANGTYDAGWRVDTWNDQAHL